MLFSIITPTHKRASGLSRAIESLKEQSYEQWEMIIINDSPDDQSYAQVVQSIHDPRIHYVKNDANRGVNFSRNRALDLVSKNTEWIIFLDDDDYLAEDALATFVDLTHDHPNESWFVCNRATEDGKSLTQSPWNDTHVSYIWDYLITKRFKGDATHCIRSSIIRNIRFSATIKQGEEWIFFYELSTKVPRFFYHNYNATLTNGYTNTGLNFRKKILEEQKKILISLVREGCGRHICNGTFMMYLFLRFFRFLLLRVK